jgi:hypothetical protein
MSIDDDDDDYKSKYEQQMKWLSKNSLLEFYNAASLFSAFLCSPLNLILFEYSGKEYSKIKLRFMLSTWALSPLLLGISAYGQFVSYRCFKVENSYGLQKNVNYAELEKRTAPLFKYHPLMRYYK